MKYLAIAYLSKITKLTLSLRFSLKVIAVSLLGLIPNTLFLASAIAIPPAFNDIEGHWAQQCIEQLAQRQIMGEYSYGLFQPNLPMTRGDYAAMIIQAFPDAPLRRMELEFNFIDLPETYWGTASIREAWLTGFVIGYQGNIFVPFVPISRLEVVLSLMAGLGYITQIPEIPEATNEEILLTDPVQIEQQRIILERLNRTFADANQIPPYAREVIVQALDHNLIVNYPNHRLFRPNHPATRGEISAFLCQALETTAVIPSRYIVKEK